MREAQKYLAKGQIDKAISEWESLLAESPDANSFNLAGDLYLRKGDRAGAIEKFHRAAGAFREEGFSLKALAIYKKILNIAPADATSLFAIGELSEEKNITADAVKYYMTAGETFLREGRKEEAVHAFYKVTVLEPDDLAFRQRLAEIFSKEGFVGETSNEYVEIARLLEKQGKAAEAMEYLERAAEIKPGNRAALMAAVSLQEKLGDREKAISLLREAIARTGKSDVFLLWLARLLLEDGQAGEARENARELLQMDPENLAAARLVADSYAREGDMKAAWPEYESVLEKLAGRNGLDEAIGILEGLREAEPVEVRKKLAALYRQKGEDGAALTELKELVRLLEEGGDAEGALFYLREALAIAPGDASLLGKLMRELDPSQTGPSEQREAPNAHDNAGDVSGVLARAGSLAAAGRLDEARMLLEPLRTEDPSNIDLHLKLKSLYLAAGERELAVTECIILAGLFERQGRGPEKEMMISEAFRIDPADARLIERWGAPSSAGQKNPSAGEKQTYPPDPGTYIERLSEAAFYKDQGLYEEAEKIYMEYLDNFPDDAGVRARLDELAALKLKPDEAITSSGDVIGGGAAALGGAHEMPEGDIERLFADFKAGIERQIDPGDAEARYNLGIAYKEMGLIEDAIKELSSVAQDPLVGIRAASILAACHMERNEFAQAARILREAVKKADPAEQTHWALKYDLAIACEKNSGIEEALKLYGEIYRWNPGFRDIAARMEAAVKAGNKGKEVPARTAASAGMEKVEGGAASEAAGDGTAGNRAAPGPSVKNKNRISYI